MSSESVEKIKLELQSLEDYCFNHERIVSPTNTEAKLILANVRLHLSKINSMIEDQKNEDTPLTKKEVEVLSHISNGFTNREIASALGISPKTVEYHVKSILTKTEASNRTEAALNAVKLGWIKT